MSEPTYGSGPGYDPQQGYGSQPGYSQPYGGQQAPPPQHQPPQHQPPQHQQPQPQYGGYGQPPGTAGYPSGGYRAAASGPAPQQPAAPRTPADRLGLVATVVTIVGYVCAGAGVLGFILWLTVDGDGTYRFATGLQTLVVGIGLGGLNYAVGSWLGSRGDTTR